MQCPLRKRMKKWVIFFLQLNSVLSGTYSIKIKSLPTSMFTAWVLAIGSCVSILPWSSVLLKQSTDGARIKRRDGFDTFTALWFMSVCSRYLPNIISYKLQSLSSPTQMPSIVDTSVSHDPFYDIISSWSTYLILNSSGGGKSSNEKFYKLLPMVWNGMDCGLVRIDDTTVKICGNGETLTQ